MDNISASDISLGDIVFVNSGNSVTTDTTNFPIGVVTGGTKSDNCWVYSGTTYNPQPPFTIQSAPYTWPTTKAPVLEKISPVEQLEMQSLPIKDMAKELVNRHQEYIEYADHQIVSTVFVSSNKPRIFDVLSAYGIDEEDWLEATKAIEFYLELDRWKKTKNAKD